MKFFKWGIFLIRKMRVLFFLLGINFLYGRQVKIGKLFFTGRFVFDVVSNKFSVIIKNVVFRDNCKIRIRKGAELFIGEKVFFNSNCSINCMQNIKIGNNTLFGESVKIYDHNHKFAQPDELIKDQGYSSESIIIGENCWIGSNSIILKGVTIGENSVIGANCIVAEKIPANSLVKNDGKLLIEKIESRHKN